MSQTHTSNVPVGIEKPFALIEREGKIEDWFFKLYLPAIVVLFVFGSFVLLSQQERTSCKNRAELTTSLFLLAKQAITTLNKKNYRSFFKERGIKKNEQVLAIFYRIIYCSYRIIIKNFAIEI